jgi:hypothetical protein
MTMVDQTSLVLCSQSAKDNTLLLLLLGVVSKQELELGVV